MIVDARKGNLILLLIVVVDDTLLLLELCLADATPTGVGVVSDRTPFFHGKQ